MKWINYPNQKPTKIGEYVVKYQNYILSNKVRINTSKGAYLAKFDGVKFNTSLNITHWLEE